MKRVVLIVLAAAAASLALPAAALGARGAAARPTPVASRIVNTPPKQVLLRYSEAVEPRFAIVSVTNAAGDKETTGAPSRSSANADTLVVPLKKLAEGWYLVYWRVISVDGHPVRGAFTFAVGPNAASRAAVRDPVDLGDRGHAAARDRALAGVPLLDGGDRAVRPADRRRQAGGGTGAGDTPAGCDDRLRGRVGGGATRDPGLRPALDGGVCAPFLLELRRPLSARPRFGLRPQLARPRARLRALRRSRCGCDLARPARAASAFHRGLARARRRPRCRGRVPTRAGPGRARRADLAPRPLAGLRLVPSRRGLCLGRRTDRVGRARGNPAGRAPGRGSSFAFRASRTWRSCPCSS